MTKKPEGPIRRGSVVLIDFPEDAPEREQFTEDSIPDGFHATVLGIEGDKAHLLVGDDYGPLDTPIPLEYLHHETEPFGEAERNAILYRFERINEHERMTPPAEFEVYGDGFLKQEMIQCKHCYATILIEHVAVETDEEMICLLAEVRPSAEKRCLKNPYSRGILHPLKWTK